MATEPGKFWFTLDNAAKIFPAVITKEVTSVFRLTVVLNHPVKIKSLQRAVLLAHITASEFEKDFSGSTSNISLIIFQSNQMMKLFAGNFQMMAC